MAKPTYFDKDRVLQSQKKVAEALAGVVKIPVQVVPSTGEGNQWWNTTPSTIVRFQLQARTGAEFAQLPNRQRVPIFPLAESSKTQKSLVFVYTERWLCERRGAFLPHDASIAAGALPHGGVLETIVRADWDARSGGDDFSNGQPHWHAMADDKGGATLELEQAPVVAVLDDPEEAAGEAVEATTEQDYFFGGVHLPMGGWENMNAPVALWRCNFSLDALPKWARAVVEHLAEELADSRYLRWGKQ